MTLTSALRANAAFTGTCALVCLVASDFVARHTGLPDVFWIIGLGVMLLAFVPMLLFASVRPIPRLVNTIIVLDWGYVAVAGAFVALNWQQADAIGVTMAFVTALVVAIFAVIQKWQLSAESRI